MSDDRTTLSLAAARGKVEVIRYLLEAGVDITEPYPPYFRTALFDASENGQVEAITALVGAGIDVNHVDHRDQTALSVASANGHVDAIEALVNAGAAVECGLPPSTTALFHAASEGQIGSIDALVKLVGRAHVNDADEQDQTALFWAANEGKVLSINALVGHGADVHHADSGGRTALVVAAGRGHAGAIDALVLLHGAKVEHTDNNGQTALCAASLSGQHVDAINSLVNAGAKVDRPLLNGYTALFYAAYGGNDLSIKALVRKGANANYVDDRGQTPLFVALRKTHLEACVALLDAGANPSYKDPQEISPLFIAPVSAIDALLKKGADVNETDSRGKTPIFYAALHGRLEELRALVGAGANVNHVAKDGSTALFHSVRSRLEIMEALLKAGADINHVNENGNAAIDWIVDPDVKSAFVGHGACTGFDLFRKVDEVSRKRLLQHSMSLKDYIVGIVESETELKKSNPFNISLDAFSDDGKMGMFFRYGWDTVVSIYFVNGSWRVSHMKATAPICAGDGRVIYTKTKDDGNSHVFENSIDLQGTENDLCHALSTPYEKNWGCFGRSTGGSYFIVYSVIPLRIFSVQKNTRCSELPDVRPANPFDYPPDTTFVKKEYPNFEAIEKIFVKQRDSRGTSIFRGGTRGIEFGDEYLFVGHVTLHQKLGECFPNWFIARNSPHGSNRMYFMYFFTIRLANGMFKISRMSSCFQPPSRKSKRSFHKIIFPCGIARRKNDILVSFGRDDSDCLVVSYPEADVHTMLTPVHFWDETNYVFHPNYAASLKRSASVKYSSPSSIWSSILPTGRVALIGTSPDSDGRFNPAITNIGTRGDMFITAWRKLNGSVQTWEGYNQVAMESCSLKIKGGKLVYTGESELVEFQAGKTTVGGEDPRLITDNDCPLLMINDLDGDNNRRMYVHNLKTDESAMTIHPFCHNISTKFEKNWGPFYVDGELCFVYSINPFVVGKVINGFRCPIEKPSNIECEKLKSGSLPRTLRDMFVANDLKMRGGTPGVLFAENEYLFVGHAVQQDDNCFADFAVQRSVNASNDPAWRKNYPKLYTAFFYTIAQNENEWEITRLSCCSQLPGKRENFTKIHFPSGLATANLGGDFEDAFIVSFGEKDMYGGFCAVNRAFLNRVLRPVSEWDTQNYVVDVNYFNNIATIN